ncbi:TrkH family potassium uptake protein [Fusobacterium ulcerans]|jgi:trk system potassium uptake protein TrkH|uniref:TrkH family potassium uptake protein n=1 Tax=Fusobacterium ulcerans 12-1B TaxID=457404 RepID=H1PRH8_9FUSO|nr:TrkH family potassium uptake protein [Fusobacterium ulcerans]EHO82991.2 hypothetical protein HMPREF0402_01021 [Fusobacterium ulcerans 12-1B]RGY65681.1 TrkH family potassium uptake protein [Fusobacterium ulcerans]
MNSKMIKYVIGYILKLEAGFMLVPLALSFFYKEGFKLNGAYLLTIILLIVSSFLLSRKIPEDQRIYTQEGMVIVSVSWIALSFFGSLPFVFSERIPSFIDAFFETVAGFTTTGASVIADIEIIEKSLLFWVGFSHFIGGMGILVLALAILPKSSNQSLYIMKAEVPGPSVGKMVAKISHNSKILYIMYICITIIMIILLRVGGMPLFDSVIHAFGTVSTGGANIKNSSVGFYNSTYIHFILGTGMLLCAVNFNLFYALILKNYKQVYRNEELRAYLLIIFMSIIIICINIYPFYQNNIYMVRDVFFTVSSIITTTGYSTVDFNTWPMFSKTVLMILTFVGGCAGSTTGGIKVSRIVIVFKKVMGEVKKVGTPNRVIAVKMDGKKIPEEMFSKISTYLVIYIFIFLGIMLLISMEFSDFTSAFSVVSATFNNIGTGVGTLGDTFDYSSLSNISKIVLSISMLLGRLEIFPVLILFSPKIYKNRNYF